MSGARFTFSGLRCRWVKAQVPFQVMDGRALGTGSERHLSRCIGCQAEAANYRTMARALRSLREEHIQAPPGLVFRVMAGVNRPQPEPGHVLERLAVVVSVVVVAVAMALLGRRRPRPAN